MSAFVEQANRAALGIAGCKRPATGGEEPLEPPRVHCVFRDLDEVAGRARDEHVRAVTERLAQGRHRDVASTGPRILNSSRIALVLSAP
jgi:hypothetical protein